MELSLEVVALLDKTDRVEIEKHIDAYMESRGMPKFSNPGAYSLATHVAARELRIKLMVLATHMEYYMDPSLPLSGA